LVQSDYRLLLNRPADPTGLAAFTRPATRADRRADRGRHRGVYGVLRTDAMFPARNPEGRPCHRGRPL